MRKTSRGYTEGQHDADRTLLVGGVYGALTVDYAAREATATCCNIQPPRLSHVTGVDLRQLTEAPYRMRDPIIIPTDEGLFCPAGDFHIDPWRPVATAVITHAHADHARSGSARYLAHHLSLPIMRHRLGEHRFTGMDYGEQRRFGAITLSLHPAGSPALGCGSWHSRPSAPPPPPRLALGYQKDSLCTSSRALLRWHMAVFCYMVARCQGRRYL